MRDCASDMADELNHDWYDRYQTTLDSLPGMSEEDVVNLAAQLEKECAAITGDDAQSDYDRAVCGKLIDHVVRTIWILRGLPYPKSYVQRPKAKGRHNDVL